MKFSHRNRDFINDTDEKNLGKIEKWIEDFVKKEKSAIGLLLFEGDDGKYTLVYASTRVCKYLNITPDKQSKDLLKNLPLEQFLDMFKFSKSDYDELVKSKHFDLWVTTDDAPKPKLVNLAYHSYEYGEAKLYEVLVYDSPEKTSSNQPATEEGIFARTFGHFDLFVNGKPVAFSSAKEKELMALLIDRNGGAISSKEAISYLWEDVPIDAQLSAKYRKLALSLKNTLTRYNAEHIVINHNGTRSIDTTKIKCDYYELLAGNEKYRNSFRNVYMSDYSWAESTLATLWDYS